MHVKQPASGVQGRTIQLDLRVKAQGAFRTGQQSYQIESVIPPVKGDVSPVTEVQGNPVFPSFRCWPLGKFLSDLHLVS